VKGGYAVFRSSSAFDETSFRSALLLGQAARGAQTYTDYPPDTKPYYYLVLGVADDGKPYQVFIPARNATVQGTAIASAPKPASSQPPKSLVSSLSARTKGEAIVLNYSCPSKARLVVYRGYSPILQASDLLDASLVATFEDKDGSFADYPVPGVDFYYAIIGEDELRAGKIVLALGVNSLKQSIELPSSAISAGFVESGPSSRTTPLPSFLVEDGSPTGKAIVSRSDEAPELKTVSPETEKAIALLLAKAPDIVRAMPVTKILPEELSSPSGGEDYALSVIVSEKIASKDWANAADQLRKYLSLNRSPKAAARARFYLGQALAHQGANRDSFFEFLSAQPYYPVETKPWIEYVLAALRS
jgi:Uncharacterized protein conserved in bacteria